MSFKLSKRNLSLPLSKTKTEEKNTTKGTDDLHNSAPNNSKKITLSSKKNSLRKFFHQRSGHFKKSEDNSETSSQMYPAELSKNENHTDFINEVEKSKNYSNSDEESEVKLYRPKIHRRNFNNVNLSDIGNGETSSAISEVFTNRRISQANLITQHEDAVLVPEDSNGPPQPTYNPFPQFLLELKDVTLAKILAHVGLNNLSELLNLIPGDSALPDIFTTKYQALVPVFEKYLKEDHSSEIINSYSSIKKWQQRQKEEPLQNPLEVKNNYRKFFEQFIDDFIVDHGEFNAKNIKGLSDFEELKNNLDEKIQINLRQDIKKRWDKVGLVFQDEKKELTPEERGTLDQLLIETSKILRGQLRQKWNTWLRELEKSEN
jgi:hypothetical protein